jgi:3-hydroxybutyryl-CoA dehydratase
MSNHWPASRVYRYHEIAVGTKETREYVITPEVYENFLTAFHDYSPVHVDEEYAKSRGFPGRVMHGSLLNGFVSHFVGMYFPGRLSLLLDVDMRYSNPSYLGDVVRMEAEVSQKVDARNVIILHATLSNTTRSRLAARARISVMVKGES